MRVRSLEVSGGATAERGDQRRLALAGRVKGPALLRFVGGRVEGGPGAQLDLLGDGAKISVPARARCRRCTLSHRSGPAARAGATEASEPGRKAEVYTASGESKTRTQAAASSQPSVPLKERAKQVKSAGHRRWHCASHNRTKRVTVLSKS